MKRIGGGSTVHGGYYWNLKGWDIAAVQGEVGRLPGNQADTYLHVPLPAMLVLVPVLGAAYALFLPAAGIAMAVWGAGKKLGVVGKAAVEELAATVSPTWRPGEAHFASKPDRNQAGDKARDPSLEKLQKELEQKRHSEKKS